MAKDNTDKKVDEKILKSAYDKGFVTQALVSGKSEEETKKLYKVATRLGERNKQVREVVLEMLEETKSE